MESVTGIGGIFLKAKDPKALSDRYRNRLGVPAVEDGYGVPLARRGGSVEESGYRKFGWVMDPEGSRVELWQPPD